MHTAMRVDKAYLIRGELASFKCMHVSTGTTLREGYTVLCLFRNMAIQFMPGVTVTVSPWGGGAHSASLTLPSSLAAMNACPAAGIAVQQMLVINGTENL